MLMLIHDLVLIMSLVAVVTIHYSVVRKAAKRKKARDILRKARGQ